MLKQESMPVWVLADCLIVLLVTASLMTISLMPLVVQQGDTENALQAAYKNVKHLNQQADSLKQANENRERQIRLLQAKLAETEARMRQSNSDLIAERNERQREQSLRQELLGLSGDMSRTLFLVDISGSVVAKVDDNMIRPNWGGDGSPWGFVRRQISTWIRMLPVQQYRIIAFNHQLREFPNDSSWACQTRDENALAGFLNSLQPAGTTNLDQAIARAKAWRPSCMVLLTDGAPTDTAGKLDRAQVDRILAGVQSDRPGIPINVVAINNYFDIQFGSFLHGLAARSRGSFVGL